MTTITNCHEKRGVHLKSMGMNKVGGWVMWQTGANWGYLSRSPCPPPSPPPAEASVSHWLSANHQPDITIRPNRVSKKQHSDFLCDYASMWYEREEKNPNKWREIPKFASLVYPCYLMWKLFEGKGRCAVFILFKINSMFHVRLWFVLLPKQLLSVSFCGWFTVALTFATKQLYIISTVRKFPIPSIPIKET